MHNGFEQGAVHHVKALRVDIEHGQRTLRHLQRDAAVGLDISVIAHAAQQAVGDAWGAAAAAGNFKRAFGIGWNI